MEVVVCATKSCVQTLCGGSMSSPLTITSKGNCGESGGGGGGGRVDPYLAYSSDLSWSCTWPVWPSIHSTD